MVDKSKIRIISNLKSIFNAASFLVIFNIQGIRAETMRQLRHTIYKNCLKIKVYKNTFKKIAIYKSSLSSLSIKFTGQTAVLWDIEDRPILAQILKNFDDTFITSRVKVGIYQGKLISRDYIKYLSSIPDLNTLKVHLLNIILNVIRKIFFTITYQSTVVVKFLKIKYKNI